jgi:O-antigen/teichoic acid export membrane protein
MWQVAGAGWQTLVQLGASAILARLLMPADYGMVGMAMLVQNFVRRLACLGSGAGVIAKRDVTQTDLSTSFWLALGIQTGMFAIAFAAAPLAEVFFAAPGLTWVLRAMSFTFVLNGLSNVSGTLLTKELRFGAIKVIESVSIVLQSIAAILLAWLLGWGYWALVSGLLFSTAVGAAAKLVLARWRPSLTFSRESFRYMFRFGANEFGSSVVSYFHANLDYVVVGKMLGQSVLGLYEFAFRIPHLLRDRLAHPVGLVLFPTLAKAGLSDERLAAGYVKTVKYIAIIIFPLLAGLAALAYPAVAVLWGEKWLRIVVPLKILCLSAAIRSVMSPIGSVFLCKGRPDIPFKFALATLVVTGGSVLGLGMAFGLEGVALGMLASLAPVAIQVWLAFRLMNQPTSRMVRGLSAPTMAAAACGGAASAAAWIVSILGGHVAVQLVGGVACGGLTYLAMIRLVFPDTFEDVVSTVRIILSRRQVGRIPPAAEGDQTAE